MSFRTPTISIIVPVYNAEKTLVSCIDSILQQSYVEYEIILVNDGSLDKSSEICYNYSIRDQRINLIQKENEGVSSARNLGLDNAKGEFILFLDADDVLLPGALERLMHENEEIDLVIGGVLHVVSSCPNGFLNIPETYKYELLKDAKQLDSLLCQVYVTAPWSKRFRRFIIEKNNLRFDKNLFYGEDTDFVLRYISKINNIKTVDSAITRYNDAREARYSKYNMKTDSFICLAESISRDINILKDITGYDFLVLNNFLSGYATDIYFDTLTHNIKFNNFKCEIKKIRERLDLINPSSRKKKILSKIISKNTILAYLISRIYYAINI